MVEKLDAPQPVFLFPPLDAIPDGDEDKPVGGKPLGIIDDGLRLPPLVFGAGPFSQLYNSADYVTSTEPFRALRLALRYGISCIDTSPFYGVSEILLGTALKVLEPEFPRPSYKLVTKVGRYGQKREDFDYSPATVRTSVMRSLDRMKTTFLDIVYVHDVDHVCGHAQPPSGGDPAVALPELEKYGLAQGQEADILGGDKEVLDAVGELRRLKAEGVIKAVGISGYPLSTLLRLAILVLNTPPYEPLDVVLSFSQLTIQNTALTLYTDALRNRGGVPQIVAAAPFNMGFLTPRPASWHNPPKALADTRETALQRCSDEEGGLPGVALGFSYRLAKQYGWPMVTGFSTMQEVHETMRVWRELEQPELTMRRQAREEDVRRVFRESGYLNWSSLIT